MFLRLKIDLDLNYIYDIKKILLVLQKLKLIYIRKNY